MKKILSTLLTIFMIMFIGSCGEGYDLGSSYVAPPTTYDATGTWDFHIENYYLLSCNYPSDCRDVMLSYYHEIKDITQVTITQTGSHFVMTFGTNTKKGYIEREEYTSDEPTSHTTFKYNQVGVANTMTFTMHGENYLTGSIEVNYYRELALFIGTIDCGFTINFAAWREGIRDPIIRVDPLEQDFGVVELNTKKEYNVTVFNDGNPESGSPLHIDEVTVDDHNFGIDWNINSFSNDIPPGTSQTFSVFYEPLSWNVENLGNVTIKSNDPNTPSVIIPLKGSSSKTLPEIQISVDGVFPDSQGKITSQFPGQTACSVSKPKEIVIKNIGEDNLDIRIDDTNNCFYSLLYNQFPFDSTDWNNGSLYLTPGDSLTLECVFHPDDSYGDAYVSSEFKIYSNDPNHKEVDLGFGGNVITDYISCSGMYCP